MSLLLLSAANRQSQAQPNLEPGSSHKNQIRFSFWSQSPTSENQVPIEKLLPPPHSLPNPAQPIQPQPSPLNRHFQTQPNPTKLKSIFSRKTLQLQKSVSSRNTPSPSPSRQPTQPCPSPQPPAPSPQPQPQPQPPAQPKLPKSSFSQKTCSKLSLKTFRSILSLKTFLAPKPLTISINPKPEAETRIPQPKNLNPKLETETPKAETDTLK